MLPEIALTSQFMDRFTRRFGCPPVEWHSALSLGRARPRLARRRQRGGARRGRRPLRAVPALQGPRPDRRRRGARRRLQAGGPRALPGAATWPWCAAAWPSSPSSWPRPRRRSRATSTPAPAATATSQLPGRYSGAELPEVETIDLRQHPPERGKWLSPVLVEAMHRDARQEAAGAAVPQPPRLRAAHAVPHLRPPHRLPAVHGLAGRAPLPPPAQLPPLRLLAADPGEVPQVRRAGRAGRLRPGRRAHRRGGGRALSRGARGPALLRPGAVADRDARDHQEDRGRRGRHHHRHADGGQGPPLPAARQRRHRRRRPGARPGRPARGRAHLPAHAPGDGPRRARAAPPAAASCRPTCPSTP